MSGPTTRFRQGLEPAFYSSPSPDRFYEERVRQLVRPGDRILDAGCGLGKCFSFAFARALGCRITGVDTDDDLLLNPNLDVRVRGDLSKLPFSHNSFDLITCRLVVEHLKNPRAAFDEFHRVLKPGGKLAIFTPNLLHYFGASANATPEWFHLWFNSQIRGFDATDIFPTYYRANTRRRLTAQLTGSGFTRIEVLLVEGAPDVLAFNFILHSLGEAYKRAVNRFEFLSPLRLNIIAISERP